MADEKSNILRPTFGHKSALRVVYAGEDTAQAIDALMQLPLVQQLPLDEQVLIRRDFSYLFDQPARVRTLKNAARQIILRLVANKIVVAPEDILACNPAASSLEQLCERVEMLERQSDEVYLQDQYLAALFLYARFEHLRRIAPLLL